MNVSVNYGLWKEVSGFFSAIVRPCKDCLRGNPNHCWESRCSVFKFRGIAFRVGKVSETLSQSVRVRPHLEVENEILEKLGRIDGPVRPRDLYLQSTNSKVNKCHAISRLIRKKKIDEIRAEDGSRMILLHKKEPKK